MMKKIKLTLLLIISGLLLMGAVHWGKCINHSELYKNGMIPFQAIIFNQKDNCFHSNFVSIHDGKHLITFSYRLDENKTFEKTIDSRNSSQASVYPPWPDFMWIIKSNSKVIASGDSSVAQISGTRELFLGTVELMQNSIYSVDIQFKPSFLSLQKMLPQFTVQTESMSPLFMAGFYEKYAKLLTLIFSAGGLLMLALTAVFWKRNFFIRNNMGPM